LENLQASNNINAETTNAIIEIIVQSDIHHLIYLFENNVNYVSQFSLKVVFCQ